MARKRWIKRPGARNEAWDCWVYAYAAACHPLVRVYAKREADWAALEAKIEPRVGDIFGADDVPRETKLAAPPVPVNEFGWANHGSYRRGVRSSGIR